MPAHRSGDEGGCRVQPVEGGPRAPGRKAVNWTAVEAEYRHGSASVRKIASGHGCSDTAIRQRAEAEGWTRELRNDARAAGATCEVRSANRRAGNGPGWGGPANGPGATPKTPRPFSSDWQPSVDAKLRGKEMAERMRHVLASVAEDDEAPPQARVAAADKLLDRLEGRPVQPNVTLNVDDVGKLSDADLTAELARLGGTTAEAVAGSAGEGVPPQPVRVVN